jgi:hypothetical protein
MSLSANVRSVEAIRQFRVSVLKFAEEATAAAEMLRQQAHRALEWIDHDRPAFWRNETRRCFDDVAEARSHLAKRQQISVGGRRPACIEEKNTLQKARRRLETATSQNTSVRQWSVKIHRAADIYATRIARLDRILVHDVPQLVALLERIITALEAYATSENRSSRTAESEPIAERTNV